MILKKSIPFVCAMSILLMSGLAHAGNSVLVTARAREARNGHIMVTFTLTNCGAKKIAVQYGNLPWKQTFTTLTAYVGSGNFAKMLPSTRPLADYPSHIVYIAPHTSKQGSVDLDFYIPSLHKLNDYSNLIVFWSYEFTDINYRVLRTFGGMLTLHDPIRRSSCDN